MVWALISCWPVRQSLTYQERTWFLSLWALFIVALSTYIQSIESEETLKSVERFLRIATIAPIFMLFVRYRVEAARWLPIALPLAALVLGYQAYDEMYVQGNYWVEGIYYKIAYGALAVYIAALSVAVLLTVARGWIIKTLLILTALLSLYMSILAQARGGWILIPVVGLLLVYLYRHTFSRRYWIAGTVGLVVAVAMLVLFTPQGVEDGIKNGFNDLRRFMDDPSQSSSWGNRINLWWNALYIWWDNPIWGTGLGDFHHDSNALIDAGLSTPAITRYGHAHNIFIDALAKMGLVGSVLLVISMFILPWRLFLRTWEQAQSDWLRFYSLGGMLTLVAFAVFGLTEGWTTRNPLVNPYVIYLSVFASSLHISRSRLRSSSSAEDGETG